MSVIHMGAAHCSGRKEENKQNTRPPNLNKFESRYSQHFKNNITVTSTDFKPPKYLFAPSSTHAYISIPLHNSFLYQFIYRNLMKTG